MKSRDGKFSEINIWKKAKRI